MIAFLFAGLLLQSPGAAPPRLADGVRQVEQGDFEGAIVTLRAVTAEAAGDPARASERARAHLHLGIAHVALGQAADAHTAFLAALRDDPGLRVDEKSFSPKVVAAFEAARREHRATLRSGSGPSTGRIVGAAAVGAAVAGGLALGLGRGEEPAQLTIANARFSTPLVTCPDGAVALPVPFGVLAEVKNDGEAQAAVTSLTVIGIIVDSIDPEIGFASQRPATIAPTTFPGGRSTPVRIESTFQCDNGTGGPPRFNDWVARVTINTTAGVLSIETADRMRVVIP